MPKKKPKKKAKKINWKELSDPNFEWTTLSHSIKFKKADQPKRRKGTKHIKMLDEDPLEKLINEEVRKLNGN